LFLSTKGAEMDNASENKLITWGVRALIAVTILYMAAQIIRWVIR